MAQIDSRGDPGSPIQSKNDVGDAKNVLQKLLPVEGRHLGKWPLSTNSYSMAPPQPETIDKTRFRREKRLGKTTSGSRTPSWKMADFDRFGFWRAQAVRLNREIMSATTRGVPYVKGLRFHVKSPSALANRPSPKMRFLSKFDQIWDNRSQQPLGRSTFCRRSLERYTL